MLSFASFLAVRLLRMRYTMQAAAITKKVIATKEGINKNKIPKPIEIMVDIIATKESVARL